MQLNNMAAVDAKRALLQQEEKNTGAQQVSQGKRSGAGVARMAQEVDASTPGQQLPHHDGTSTSSQHQATAIDQTIIRHPCLLKGG
jgi:hypothetical protein